MTLIRTDIDPEIPSTDDQGGVTLTEDITTDVLTITNTGTGGGINVTTVGTSPAVSITQRGTGNCLVVKDVLNDTTPLTIDQAGKVIVGHTSAMTGASNLSSSFQVNGTGTNTTSIGIGQWAFSGQPILHFYRSSASPVGYHATVNTDDITGNIIAAGSDGTTFYRTGQITFQVDGNPTTGVMPGKIRFYTNGGGTVVTERLRIDSSGNILNVSTGGLGYGTGSGGAVTQITSRITPVTIDKTNGAITLFSDAGTTSWKTFTVNNSKVAATDTIHICQKSGTNLYMVHITAVADGSFDVSFASTGGATTEQPVFNFAVIKGVTS